LTRSGSGIWIHIEILGRIRIRIRHKLSHLNREVESSLPGLGGVELHLHVREDLAYVAHILVGLLLEYLTQRIR
jgi:hypothetical protein